MRTKLLRVVLGLLAAAGLAGCPGETSKADTGGTPPGLDAATLAPDAEAPVGRDAAAAGPDAEAEPPDAAAPGLDAAMPPDAAFVPLAAGAPCTGDDECADGRCLVIFGPPSNNYCTKACNADTDCVFPGSQDQWACALTFNSKTAKRCFKVCPGLTSDECGGGLCVPNITTGSGSTARTLAICYDLQGKLCDLQADCKAGTVCSPIQGGVDWRWFCTEESTATATLKTGEACNPNLQFDVPCRTGGQCALGLSCTSGKCAGPANLRCAGLLCWNESFTCAGPCKQDSDCGADAVCSAFPHYMSRNTPDTTDDVWGSLDACERFPGSRAACAKDADCSGGEVCSHYVDADHVSRLACRKPDTGAAAYGDQVGDDPRTPTVYEPITMCTTALTFDGLCTSTCETAADCPPNRECFATFMSAPDHQPQKLCSTRPPCRVDADCAAGSTCMSHPLYPSGELRFCSPQYGEIAPGAACDPVLFAKASVSCPDESACFSLGAGWTCNLGTHACEPPAAQVCRSGLWNCSSGYGFCSTLCDTDADCADSTFLCGLNPRPLYWTSGDPTTQLFGGIKLCQPAPGSRTPCTRAADCSDANERCAPFFKLDGTVEQLCVTKIAGGALDGKACGQGLFCENDFCDLNDGDLNPATGTCSVPCTLDGDCATGFFCKDFDLSADGTHRIKACRRAKAGGFKG